MDGKDLELTWSSAVLSIFKNNHPGETSVQDIYRNIGRYKELEVRDLEYTKWDEPRYQHTVRATIHGLYNEGVIERSRRGVYRLKRARANNPTREIEPVDSNLFFSPPSLNRDPIVSVKNRDNLNERISLPELVSRIADILLSIDKSREPFRSYQAGVGPYGEPQLLKKITSSLNTIDRYRNKVVTKRTPDILIPGSWALEFKIVRPFGDNGREAENWSVNLLHPYAGNQSSLGDCLKLSHLDSPERKAVVVIGYEHDPPVISLNPLISSFEVLAQKILNIQLGPKIEEKRANLIHPVHQQLSVIAWEVFACTSAN